MSRATNKTRGGWTAILAFALALQVMSGPARADQDLASAPADGVLRVQSAYGFDETVSRLKADVSAKKIRFIAEIDQSDLATMANIPLRPSKLLIFGNPPLGVQFLTSNPYAGIDWPVRMLVLQGPDGKVWVAWTDFAFIARRYAITDRAAAIKMAEDVSSSIAASVSGANP
jgi:uncharacterized protein (DUF302 family)